MLEEYKEIELSYDADDEADDENKLLKSVPPSVKSIKNYCTSIFRYIFSI